MTDSVLTDDVLVYAHPNGREYVAMIGDDREWYCWPSVSNGWAQRQRCSAGLAESCEELPPRLARLALLMSGVVDGV